LLIDHHGPRVPIHFVYAANRLLPRRARVFMDYIAEAFARDPALNAETGAIK
jgi:DNA-binding transcriptional LysR family regulator